MTFRDQIDAALDAHPDIVGFRFREADEFIERDCWQCWLAGAWRTDDVGHGDTLEDAHWDALRARKAMEGLDE